LNQKEFNAIAMKSVRDIYYEAKDEKGCATLDEKIQKNYKPKIEKTNEQKTQEVREVSSYEKYLHEQAQKNISFVADVLGSLQNAKDFRDGKVTLAQLGALSPAALPKRLKDI
jgi:hypothetical protein